MIDELSKKSDLIKRKVRDLEEIMTSQVWMSVFDYTCALQRSRVAEEVVNMTTTLNDNFRKNA